MKRFLSVFILFLVVLFCSSCGFKKIPVTAKNRNTFAKEKSVSKKITAKKAAKKTATAANTIPPIYFPKSKVGVCPAQQKKISDGLNKTEDYKNKKYIVRGYASQYVDPKKDNGKYALERAANVKNFLVHHGIPAEQIVVLGMGVDNSKISREKKRRVEIEVLDTPIKAAQKVTKSASTLKRFDAEVPLIPEPINIDSAEKESIETKIAHTELCPPELKNLFVGYFESSGISVGWRWKNTKKKKRLLVTFFISPKLIPASAIKGKAVIRGINEDWNTNRYEIPGISMWTEELIPSEFPIRRNVAYRRKNGWRKYAQINRAGAAGSKLAIKSSDLGFEDDDYSICIFVTSQGVNTIKITKDGARPNMVINRIFN